METQIQPESTLDNRAVISPPSKLNFAAHLFSLNAMRASKVAYIDDTREVTYQELELMARQFASALQRLDLRREERILLVMQDTVALPVAFLGALYVGVVPVVVNTLLTAADYSYMLSHSGARAVIASDFVLHAVREALIVTPAFDDCRHLILAGHIGPVPPGALSFEKLIMESEPPAKPLETRADDMAFWLYSSGSTGKPKATVHTHANLYWTAETYAKHVLGIRESDIVFSAAKLFFAYGLGNSLTFPLSVGATTVLMSERPTASAVFECIVRHKPTIFCGVPTLYANMLADPRLPKREEVKLRVCVSAGEALPKEVGERFTAHFECEILDGIGSTEMLHIFLSNRPGDVRYGTTGMPVVGYQVDLRDEAGHPVPDGEVGDLYIGGPSSAVMYWTDRDKSRATFLGEWVRSGDKYIKQSNGCFVYAGRSDDMLKVSGQYVSPIEVEMVLVQHGSVLEAAVIGINQEGLVKTRAFIVLKPDCVKTPELSKDIKLFVKTRLAPHKYPRDIVFVENLPKTATGKIQRYKLREQVNA
jgi:benzoate-CoA ligase